MRIRANVGNDPIVLKANINQSFDFLEILSIKLSQKDIYRKFTADYGVLIGRVVANGGFGIPNAKISIFLPVDEDESQEVKDLYPFKTPLDLNNQGKKYNLLPNKKVKKCHKAVGSFPSKRELLDNNILLEIHEKYYKYTTVTNSSGDYMLFGIPTGNQKIHMDVDLSDIGELSAKPIDFIEQGFDENMFSSKSEFKSGVDLKGLVQIQSRDVSTTINPFWGDSEENDISINRVDFELNQELTPTTFFIGSIFTDDIDKNINRYCSPEGDMGENCKLTTGTGKIEILRVKNELTNTVEYVNSEIKNKINENGVWAISLPCNLNRKITNEFGETVDSNNQNVGLPTSTKVRFRVSLDKSVTGIKKRSANYLIPNMYNRFSFDESTNLNDFFQMDYREIYTVSNYIPKIKKAKNNNGTDKYIGLKKIGVCESNNSIPFNRATFEYDSSFLFICFFYQFITLILKGVEEFVEFVMIDLGRIICSISNLLNANSRRACVCETCYQAQNRGKNKNDWKPIDGLCNNNNTITVFETNGWSDSSFSSFSGTSVDIKIGGVKIGEQLTYNDGTTTYFKNEICQKFACALKHGEDDSSTLQLNVDVYNGTNTQITIDFNSYVFNDCSDKCENCTVKFIEYTCRGVDYDDLDDWRDCKLSESVEEEGAINYSFYNDWLTGSLYAFNFDYKYKYKRNGSSYERFCDYECRSHNNSLDVGGEGDFIHRKNKCRDLRLIKDKKYNNGITTDGFLDNYIGYDDNIKYGYGTGLIVGRADKLYYLSNNYINSITEDVDFIFDEKDVLMFATTIVSLGSVDKCSLTSTKPYFIDRLPTTSYYDDIGVSTLYEASDCDGNGEINTDMTTKICQVGTEVLLSSFEMDYTNNKITDSSGDEFILSGTTTDLSVFVNSLNVFDKHTKVVDNSGKSKGIIILNRSEIDMRKHMCENFHVKSTPNVYNSTDFVTKLGGITLKEEEYGDSILDDTFWDECQNCDNQDIEYLRMHPYYVYFGLLKGKSSIDVFKNLYLNECDE